MDYLNPDTWIGPGKFFAAKNNLEYPLMVIAHQKDKVLINGAAYPNDTSTVFDVDEFRMHHVPIKYYVHMEE
jgi:hypothetical protein